MSETEPTRQTVLDLIVEKGPVTAAHLAKILSLTTAAVRRHITALESAQMIAVYETCGHAKRERGRPARHYVATGKGREGLSEDYSKLASRALGFIEQLAGPDGIDTFAAAHSRDIERRYAPLIKEAGPDPRARARALADALTADGYAATVREVGNGGFAVQLCQGNCPVQEVAGEFPQLCEAETQAFSRLLDVHVQRLATLADGEHVCTTSVPIVLPSPKILRKSMNMTD
ncbi:helix-turn-helix transcriptional regulator [Varibaculum cambriense]|uniref:helix-turn-helix transcriptional regulator n=1 Tax=Varibaculum cambriense TaxID=184870 RepID=UPI00290A6609|nr:helix-turn-helix domain-containing protein [Varibaculum cambriense]MDU3274659.1 helix-turn-helix domain-containing protein [Varibaculum cambriense]